MSIKSKKITSQSKPAAKENKVKLYEARKKIFPKDVKGKYRRFKWIWMILTLGAFAITPWLRWDRGPYASDQLLLIDIANRRFFFASIEIWPQEFYYVTGMLIMAGIGLFLTTSVVGRAWCGFSCPQTVWTDLFMLVENKVEGDRNARIRLEKGPWTVEKIFKVGLKYFIWLIISVLTGAIFTLYFADAPQLARDLISLQAPPIAYITIAILTATTFTFAGFMREQICIYMCPWPRIQGTMLDEDSLIVTYNDWRGEPRSKHAKRQKRAGIMVGDCIDCEACVHVCPTGIDIREGPQLECITCALCIDACDNVMEKIGLEKGLISYSTLKDYAYNLELTSAKNESEKQKTIPTHHASHNELMLGKSIIPTKARDPKSGKLYDKFRHTSWRNFFRPRPIIYFTVWGVIGLVMLVAVALRNPLDINVLHDRNPLYTVLSNGDVRNGYNIKILNMVPEKQKVELSIEGLKNATMELVGKNGIEYETIMLDLVPDAVTPIRLYVRADPDNLDSVRTDFNFVVVDNYNERSARARSFFEIPEK